MNREFTIYVYYKVNSKPKNFWYEFTLKSIINFIGTDTVPVKVVLFKIEKAIEIILFPPSLIFKFS